MDQAWAILGSFPSYQEPPSTAKLDVAIKSHADAVKHLVASKHGTLVDFAGPLLSKLNPETNSIAFLAVLNASIISTKPPISRSTLLNHTLSFLLAFNSYQIRYVGADFRTLLENVGSERLFPATVAVELLANALQRLDPSGTMFTSTHLILAKLAYDRGVTEPALRVIDRDIIFYPGAPGQKDGKHLCAEDLSPTAYISTDTGLTDSITSMKVLEYDLVCGLIYISRRNWQKAHQALERVVTYPSREKGVSKIMLEAHKKWLLVGLLAHGKESTLPTYTAPSSKSTYSTLSIAYKDVADLFGSANAGQLKAEVEANLGVWEEDGNRTLIQEVIEAYQKWQIINFKSVYRQVSLPVLLRDTVSAETGEPLKNEQQMAALIQGMIDTNMLQGELQTCDGDGESYLVYRDEELSFTETEFARKLAQCHSSIQNLGQQFRTVNERLGSSKEYVRYVLREQKRAEKDGGDAGIGFENQVEDEDLMTGILAHS